MRLITCCLLAGCLALATSSATASARTRPPHGAVTLTLPATSFSAGQRVIAVLVNHTSEQLQFGVCPSLAEQVDGQWVPVTDGHRIGVACPDPDLVFDQVKAHALRLISFELYDDLEPGIYRVTLPYREARFGAAPLSTSGLTVAATFRLIRRDLGPRVRAMTTWSTTLGRPVAPRLTSSITAPFGPVRDRRRWRNWR